MPSLTGNIQNRVRKLAKPSNAAQAIQPLFEAVSNSFYAVEDRFEEKKQTSGHVRVDIINLAMPDAIEIVVSDNGVGLDDAHFQAFLTIDTDFKYDKGGKGIGRLFWFDAFSDIHIESRFQRDDDFVDRAFSFVLEPGEEVREALNEKLVPTGQVGSSIRFRGLRSKEYRQFFPNSPDDMHRYFAAHFISDFLMSTSPNLTINIDGNAAKYPDSVASLVVGNKLGPINVEALSFGTLSLTGFTCNPAASFGLEGQHQLHLLANSRTVETRKVDNLLGLPNVEADGERGLVFHGCVSGEPLNTRVNEGRTGFSLTEADLKKISRACMDAVKEQFFPEQVATFGVLREQRYNAFVARHPIYGFDDVGVQLSRIPFHALKAEDFAAGLVKYQIRREEERQKTLNDLLNVLEEGKPLPADFGNTMVAAAEGVQASERLALAQHVVRRKLVLEIMERLLKRSRVKGNRPDDHYLEETLHTIICPMRVRGDDPDERKSRAHDLWIVDERLAFTRAFASDKRLDQLLKAGGSASRPDLVLWDYAVGMGTTDPSVDEDHLDVSKPLDKVMVVEFKKPGREEYPDAKDQIEQQIIKYLAQLQNEEVETFDKSRVRVAKDCVFFCYVIADIVGDLKQQLSGWDTVANGQGRIRKLSGQYTGFIEVIQWQDLVNDAWNRNQALLSTAGLKRGNPVPIQYNEADESAGDKLEDEDAD